MKEHLKITKKKKKKTTQEYYTHPLSLLSSSNINSTNSHPPNLSSLKKLWNLNWTLQIGFHESLDPIFRQGEGNEVNPSFFFSLFRTFVKKV